MHIIERIALIGTCLAGFTLAGPEAQALDKLVFHPTAYKVIDASFERAYGHDLAKARQIAQQEIDELVAAGVTGVFGVAPKTLGNRRERYILVSQMLMARGIDIYMSIPNLRVLDEYNATGPYARETPIPHTGYYMDEPILNGKPTWEATEIAGAARQRGGRPVIVIFSGKHHLEYERYLSYPNYGTPVVGQALQDHITAISVDDYSRSTPRGFIEAGRIAARLGIPFIAGVGDTEHHSASHMRTQWSWGQRYGARSLFLWTMDATEGDGLIVEYDSCYRGRIPDRVYGGGRSFTHMSCYDYGQLSFEACYLGPPQTPSPGCDNDVGTMQWGFQTVLTRNPAAWSWFAGL